MSKLKQRVHLDEAIKACDKAKDAIDKYMFSITADDPSEVIESTKCTEKALDAIVKCFGYLCYERHGKGIFRKVESKPPSEAV